MRDCEFVKMILLAQGVCCSVPFAGLAWKEWLARTFASLNMQHRQAVMVTYWAVWFTRNQVVHEGIVHYDHNTLSFVVAFLREHDVFNPPACLRPLRSHGSWSASGSDVINVKFDASYDISGRKSVSGVVCQDSEGLILVACCYPHSYVSDPFQAEALACLVAIGFARDLGFARVLLEGDSLTIIKKCSSETNDISLVSPVIADIKEVAKSFQHIRFTFAYREANVAAHTLAHEGKTFSSPMYWIEDAPRTLLAAEKEHTSSIPNFENKIPSITLTPTPASNNRRSPVVCAAASFLLLRTLLDMLLPQPLQRPLPLRTLPVIIDGIVLNLCNYEQIVQEGKLLETSDNLV
ncbi:hypothetical protein V6N12_002355 [Hibiscus sabdariffa]|uniref:RNase H type-1 domain-containing protein n=1 Tax=Hibiscus sabdariffa TaxID=183260 RepID=A0ABR2AL57_9ROSI